MQRERAVKSDVGLPYDTGLSREYLHDRVTGKCGFQHTLAVPVYWRDQFLSLLYVRM